MAFTDLHEIQSMFDGLMAPPPGYYAEGFQIEYDRSYKTQAMREYRARERELVASGLKSPRAITEADRIKRRAKQAKEREARKAHPELAAHHRVYKREWTRQKRAAARALRAA